MTSCSTPARNHGPRRLCAFTWLLAALLVGNELHAGPLREALRERRERKAQETQTDEPDEVSGSLRQLPPGVRRLENLAYGSDAKQRLDVYLSTGAPPQHAPVFVMVHGGGWSRGDKSMETVVKNKAAHWVPKGILFVSVDNRLLPQAKPLEQADDVARAVAYVQKHAESWGGDPTQVVLMGHSAGAHLAAVLASAPSRATAQGAQPWVGTVLLDSAALDVPAIMEKKHFRLYDPAFGTDPAYWKAASPYHLLTAAVAPILAVCSSRRADSPGQAHAFADRAKTVGSPVTVHEENKSHRQINDELGLPGPYTDAVDAFLRTLSPAIAEKLR